MRLDFSTLTRPASSPPSQKHWGQVGTTGTPISMRVSAPSRSGDKAGTSGDKFEKPSIESLCPQVSPVCPQSSTARKPNSHAVSPVSPLVPTFFTSTAKGDGFDREAFEERAAIMEFDGGMSRAEAEAAARAIIATVSANARQGGGA